MKRNYKTIDGLTYRDLDTVLVNLGYERHEKDNAVAYAYPKNEEALLLFPIKPMQSEVRGIDLVAARLVIDGFGIMDAHDFDSLVSRFTDTFATALTR